MRVSSVDYGVIVDNAPPHLDVSRTAATGSALDEGGSASPGFGADGGG
jgi:hypothetical protein